MQPTQQQPETNQWQQPVPTPSAAPYQAPVEQPIAPEAAAEPVIAQTPVTPAPQAEAPDATQPATSTQEVTSEQVIDEAQAQELVSDDDAALLRWQGTEYVHGVSGAKWYVFFGIVVVLMIALAIIVLRSPTFAVLVPVMAVALLLYVRRDPEILQYTLSRKGLHINDKLFTYDVFKSFGVVSHAANHSVVLIPRKRFQISQTIYFPEEIGEQLVDMLAARLPMQEISPDAIDRLLAKLKL